MDNVVPFKRDEVPTIESVETKYTIYEIKDGHKFLETLRKEAKQQKIKEETRVILKDTPFCSFGETADEDFFEIEDCDE